MQNIKGLVIDINGVLYEKEEPIGNACETLKKLREKYKVRLITNSTAKNRFEIQKKLTKMGFEVKAEEIFSPLDAIRNYLLTQKGGAFFLSTEKTKKEFADIPTQPVNFVVLTHAHEDFTYENMNRAFRYLMEGAQFLASGTSRYYKEKDGLLYLDPGPFVKALEFATGKTALVFGKPSPDFFLAAVQDMQLLPQECAMVGDDIETDVDAAKKAGLYGILVQTGKFQATDLEKNYKIDKIIKDFNAIEAFLL